MSQAEFRDAICSNPRGSVATAYRTWVQQVFMPLSEKAARLVVERADLLESSSIEPLLLQLVAHVSALKVLVRRWEQGDIDDQASPIAYPDDVRKWAEAGASTRAACSRAGQCAHACRMLPGKPVHLRQPYRVSSHTVPAR